MSRERYNLMVYLIKEEYTDFNEIQSEEETETKEYSLTNDLDLNSLLIIGPNKENPLHWNALFENTVIEYPEQFSKSARAVLLVEYNDRIFAFTFGYGKHLIDDQAIVKDFGFRVILNNAKNNSIKSMDTSIIDENTQNRRTQTSRGSSIDEFDINDLRTLFRSVSAESTDTEKYGKNITGRDGFRFAKTFNLQDIKATCEKLLEDYNKDIYKRRFPDIDNIREVRDSTLLNLLNDELIDNLNNQRNIILMVPEIIDWIEITGFSYTRHGDVFSDLNIGDFHAEKKISPITIQKLKNHKIFCRDESEVVQKWSVLDCLTTEVELDDKVYVFSIGMWFEIKQNLITRVKHYIDSLSHCTYPFPVIDGEHEEEANEIFASEIPGLLNLDRDNRRIDNSPYEVCDLLSKNKRFIHIKWWDSSATLSHLFSQGRVSAEIMTSSREQRFNLHEKIKSNQGFANVIDIEEYLPNDYTVVFGIIYKENQSISKRLPFFSAVNLMHNAQQLRGMNYNVEIVHIKTKRDRRNKNDN